MGLAATFLLGLFIGSLGGPPSGPPIGWEQVQIEVLVYSPEPLGASEGTGTRIIAYLEESDGSVTECLVSVSDS